MKFGFQKGVGTRDAIGALRTLADCFIDYEKAFDRVNWYKLMRALARLGVDWRNRRLIYRLYMNNRLS